MLETHASVKNFVITKFYSIILIGQPWLTINLYLYPVHLILKKNTYSIQMKLYSFLFFFCA